MLSRVVARLARRHCQAALATPAVPPGRVARRARSSEDHFARADSVPRRLAARPARCRGSRGTPLNIEAEESINVLDRDPGAAR
jgi:hypothetical protein